MSEPKLYLTDRKQWRAWLAKNHSKKKEIWLIYYKKSTGKKNIPYNDAVEEALCYGWIDGQVKRIDDEKHMQRFSPRRRGSHWAESNIKRVKKLISEEKMTPAGMHAFEKRPVEMDIPSNPRMPSDLKKALKKNKKAWENFNSFPRSHKKHFYWHILSAKRAETREKRINYLVKRAKENRRLM